MKNITKNSIFIAFLVLTMVFTAVPASAREINPSMATTLSAIEITQTTAVLRGSVNPNGNNANSWIDYGTNQSFGIRVDGPAFVVPGSFSKQVTGLTPSTTYYFRVCASSWSSQTSCGATLNFKTDADNGNTGNNDEPEVTTKSATNVDEESATLKGEIVSDSDVDYWFEYGTSSSNLSKETDTESLNDGSHSVSENISNLSSDRTYYFRLVAENEEGISYGSIKSFTTEEENNNNNNNNDEEIVVTTLASSAVTQTTAHVNGRVTDDLEDYSVSVWFEYGTTVALGYASNTQNLGKISSESFDATLTNLLPNTVYYFRAVGKNTNGTIRGDMMVFKTASLVLPPNPPANPPVNPPTPPVNNPVVGVTASKFIALQIENKFENVSAGDVIEYEVTFSNISSKDIKDAVLEVELPAQVSFEKASKGEFNKDSLVLKLDLLEAGAEEKIIITGSISRSVNAQDVLLATATVFYANPTTKVKENVTAYVVNTVVEKNLLGAASIFGNDGFLPNSLTEWALLIGAIFALIFFGRKFYADINAPKQA